MAEELLRSRHAFGTLEGVLSAISSGKIDRYDILFLQDSRGKPYIGWIDKNNNPVILEDEKEIVSVQKLPSTGEQGKIYIYDSDGYFWNGQEFINLCKPIDLSDLENELNNLKSNIENLDIEISKKADANLVNENINNLNADIDCLVNDIKACENVHEKVKYEVSNVPVGTLVKYLDNEIRVMCPTNTAFTKQSVGIGGDPYSYYMTFKTYSPNEKVVGYIEHLGDQVDSEILTDLKIDTYGRKYQQTWLALAKYDDENNVWIYHGKKSSKDHYIGWDYRIDWYDENDIMISSDNIRINLSNEDCHYTIEPYYVSSINVKIAEEAIAESKLYTDEQVAAAIAEACEVIEF